MELGKGKLLRTGLNTLYQATHPTHGLAWTDGNQVIMTDLQLQSGQARFGDSRVIGQFEHVYGLSWAPSGTADLPTLLAVQHKKHVTVWELCPSTVKSSTLSQTCEIIESHPVLPQGCVWHPKHSVLTVLTAQDVSIFPNVHCDNSRIKVDIDTQDRIHCACWTQDGQRLVVAVGNSLHSYIWDSAQKTLHKCAFCPMLDVDSSIRSITATVDSQVAITTELPLDKICSLNACEAVDVAPHGDVSGRHTLPMMGDMPPVDKWAAVSEMNSGIAISPSFSEPLDLTHVRFNQPKDEENFLLCLRKKDYLTGFSYHTKGLLLTTRTRSSSRLSERPRIKEIKSPSSTISDGSIVLDTLHRPSWVWTTLPRPNTTPEHTSTPELPNLPQRENLKKEKEIYQLSKEVEILTRNLIEMKQYLFEFLDFAHNEKKSSPVYPLSQDPPYVHLIYQKPCSVDPAEKKVLLCDGKLRLSTVQQIFGLSLVEMLHDSQWILLSADSQGFIPLTFTATQAVVVRDGSLSRSDVSRDSFSQSCSSS